MVTELISHSVCTEMSVAEVVDDDDDDVELEVLMLDVLEDQVADVLLDGAGTVGTIGEDLQSTYKHDNEHGAIGKRTDERGIVRIGW